MVAELLQRGDLRADGDLLTKDLDCLCTALDSESSRPRRLKADEEHQVSRLRQALHQVMQYASAGDHATGGNDNARIPGFIDLLRLLLRDIEVKVRPL